MPTVERDPLSTEGELAAALRPATACSSLCWMNVDALFALAGLVGWIALLSGIFAAF